MNTCLFIIAPALVAAVSATFNTPQSHAATIYLYGAARS